MRTLLLLFALGLANLHVNSETIIVTDEQLSLEFAAETLGEFLIGRIVKKRQEQLRTRNARIPILPPITITLPFQDYRLEFPEDNLLIQGHYEHNDTVLEFKMSDDLGVTLPTENITIDYMLNVEELGIKGQYDLGMSLNFSFIHETFPDIPDVGDVPLTGNGPYEIGMNNVLIHLSIELGMNGSTIQTVTSKAVLSVGEVNIYFDKLAIGGEELNEESWHNVNALVQLALNGVLGTLTPILEMVLDTELKPLLEGCNIRDILDEDLSCLGIPTSPTELPGPTTQRATPPYIEDSSSKLASTEHLIFSTIFSVAALFYARG